MPNENPPISCHRESCKFNDENGFCIFDKPQLEKKEAYTSCLSQENRVE